MRSAIINHIDIYILFGISNSFHQKHLLQFDNLLRITIDPIEAIKLFILVDSF